MREAIRKNYFTGLKDDFSNPGSMCRGAPLWAWNGRLKPEELRRQIRLLRRMGLGGFFMHPRTGLDTAYLSEEWFDCVNACIDEAGKLGMKAWLYDEDRYTSGAAGGLVTKNPDYRIRQLIMREIKDADDFAWHADTVAVFTGHVDGYRADHVRRITRNTRPVPSKRETILEFRVMPEPCSDWYNGYAALDVMNHEAVRKFIKVTHEAYRRHSGRAFGKVVPGIFTDEPQHGACVAPLRWAQGYGTPWTGSLPAVFRKRYGYDLIERLPEVFFDVDGQTVSQARYHYNDCITHLFVDAFGRQIGEWCGRNRLLFTGHVTDENILSYQAAVAGSCMRFYEHMQVPGMDLIEERYRIWDAAKQVSSAARQFGRKWRLTETYGCTGWDFPFAGHKAQGDWQVALGINLRCQHLAWYTMEGEAKRDFPASIFYQSPWWESYAKVEDYFARIHAVMTRGVEVRDLLVIHPVESMWLLLHKGWEGYGLGNLPPDVATRVNACDRMLMALRDTLLAANLDFDYGDEDILARHGKSIRENGRPVLRLAQATYRAVLVPPLTTMRRSTLKLLRKFREAGGTVVFAGAPAGYVDARPSTEVIELARQCQPAPTKGSALSRAVETVVRRVSIADAAGKEIVPALHLLREDADAFYLFICNTGRDFIANKMRLLNEVPVWKRTLAFPDVRIRGFAGCRGKPVELDPDTGRMYAADAVAGRDGWEICTSLPELGSRLFVIPKKAGSPKYPRRPRLQTVGASVPCGGAWKISLSESNNLVLDRPASRIGSGHWRKAADVLRVDSAVRDTLGIPHRHLAMMQPWARKKSAHPRSIVVTLQYEFQVKTVPSGDLFLAVERPGFFRICLNDLPLDTDMESGWWTDRSLRKVPLDPAALRPGPNTLTLTCDYDENHPGLESIHLLGAFGVKVKGTEITMTAAPSRLGIGNWVRQGLPFYSGSVSYQKVVRPRLRKGERLFLEVPEYRAAAVRVLVDGKPAGIIAWKPNEVEITDFIKGPAVQLTIEVLGHRRNSHGPLHVSAGKKWVDGYQFVRCGLMKPPRFCRRLHMNKHTTYRLDCRTGEAESLPANSEIS